MTLSLSARAEHWPERTAVRDDARDATLSYGELAARIDAVAGRLATAGVEPGDRVVVVSRNRIELLALLFAARKRGATIAPISHRLPAEGIETLFGRIDPAFVLHEPRSSDLLANVTVPTKTFSWFQEQEPASSEIAGESDSAPLFLHTGGTTGVPKVVPISERQLEWNAITETVAWGLDEETVSLVVLPLFHTGGWNLLTLPTLYAGGTVILRPSFEPGPTLRCLEEYGVTQLFAVPAIYQAMADHPEFEETNFSSVEWFMSGGGPCTEEVMVPYRDRGELFVQGYGLTEGGPNNLYLSPERDDATDKPDSVGRPFPDCEARLVTTDGTAITGTGTGKLELRGPVTADGYLETEDGTFDGEWISTGDIFRRDKDGDYYVVGRADNMFVSGGENVYPEEIEDVLETHPDVEVAGVVGVSHEKWGTVPKAVVVGGATTTELEQYSEKRLAGFQVPHEFEFVEELPMTGAGKLDRDALSERFRERQ